LTELRVIIASIAFTPPGRGHPPEEFLARSENIVDTFPSILLEVFLPCLQGKLNRKPPKEAGCWPPALSGLD
jgi:hypothetical protein